MTRSTPSSPGSQNVYIHSGLITRGRQRQPASGRDRARARPRRRRPRDPHGRRRQGSDRHHPATMVLGAIAIAAGAGDAGMGLMMTGQQAAIGQVPRLHPRAGDQRRPCGRQLSLKAGISGKGSLEFFKKLQNQEYRLAIYAKDSYDRTHPLSSERIAIARQCLQEGSGLEQADRPGARGAVPAGQGQAGRLCQPEAGDQQLSGKRPERPGALCPRLCLSPRRLSGQSAVGGGRAARRPTRTIPSSLS